MCRILGAFGRLHLDEVILNRAISEQFNGGPDQQHIAQGQYWSLASNRLAIQGIAGGIQPFKSSGITAVYNGEIYNYLELKKELISRGYEIDDCDGSVIVPLYEIYGESFVEYLDGMFAIAIVDTRDKRKLIITNDNASIKSLYFHFDESADTLFFASELNALFALGVGKNIRSEAVNDYLIGRSVWGSDTFFKKIHVLEPATVLTKELGLPISLKHYQTKIISHYNRNHDFQEATHQLTGMLENEISKMLHADVPVCMVTSGGLDSSLLTALAAKNLNNLECFNIAYEGNWPLDERKYAQEVSGMYGVKYNQILIEEKDFPAILDGTIKSLGQPNSAPHSLSTYALFSAINKAGYKVAVTGEGADEWFSGYTRFKNAALSASPEWMNQYFDEMCATTAVMRARVYSPDYMDYINARKGPLDKAKEEIQALCKSKSRLKSLLEFDQFRRFPSYILRRVDHLSMAHSVEVRVPFCQQKIVSYAASLPDDFLIDDHAVKKILYHVASPLLPSSIIHRPKQPFTLPIVSMLKKGHVLFELLNDELNSSKFLNRGLFNRQSIQLLLKEQLSDPKPNIANMLWSIMILEKWLQQHASCSIFPQGQVISECV